MQCRAAVSECAASFALLYFSLRGRFCSQLAGQPQSDRLHQLLQLADHAQTKWNGGGGEGGGGGGGGGVQILCNRTVLGLRSFFLFATLRLRLLADTAVPCWPDKKYTWFENGRYVPHFHNFPVANTESHNADTSSLHKWLFA